MHTCWPVQGAGHFAAHCHMRMLVLRCAAAWAGQWMAGGGGGRGEGPYIPFFQPFTPPSPLPTLLPRVSKAHGTLQ